MEIREWLKERKSLSLTSIERESGIPAKTLSHYMNGRRNLNESHIRKLTPVLMKYGYASNDVKPDTLLEFRLKLNQDVEAYHEKGFEDTFYINIRSLARVPIDSHWDILNVKIHDETTDS